MKKIFIAAFLSVSLSGFAFAGEEIQLAGNTFSDLGVSGSARPMVVAALGDEVASGGSSNTVSGTQQSSGLGTLSTTILAGTGLVAAVVFSAFADTGGTSTTNH